MNNKLKLYIGCALTSASPEFIEKIKVFKQSLSGKYEVLEFLGLDSGTDKEVYENDIHNCVASCDMMVAFCDFPTLGLGYELGTAIEKYSKPVLALAHIDSKVTRFVTGINHPMYNFLRYSDISEVNNFIDDKVKKHFPVIEVNVCETDVCAV